MYMNELKDRLESDLKSLGLLDVADIELDFYNKNYEGHYYPDRNLVRVYAFYDKMLKTPYSYDYLFRNILHELAHSIQYNSPGFVRYAGIMHNEDFWKIYNKLVNFAVKKGVVCSDENLCAC